MLDAAQRMRTGSEFAETIRAGRRAGRRCLVVHLTAPDLGDAGSRAGIVVSKAVGNAVVRNRVARRLRPLIRTRLTELPDGSRLVVRALPRSASADSRQLGDDLDSALAAVRRPQ